MAQGFSEKSAEKEMTEIKCRKPLPGSKKGTLKEKNDLIVNFITSVEKKAEDIGLVREILQYFTFIKNIKDIEVKQPRLTNFDN